jgi:sugar phosphate isomerase/epimerase
MSALPGDSGPIKLSVATYSFRSFKRPEAIKMIQQLNIKFADVKDFHIPIKDATPADWKQGGKDFADAGIKIIACGNVDMKKPEEHRRAFEYAKAIGSPTIVCAPTQQDLPDIEKLAKEFKIKIAIHNHGPEDKIFPSPLDVLKFVKSMDPRMGCCIDVGHCVRAGTDVIEAIHAAGPRLFNMHVKDLSSFTDKESQVAVGEGKMPIRQIFEALIKINYPGFVDLEYEIHADDPMPGVIESFSYMRGVLSGMGYNPEQQSST